MWWGKRGRRGARRRPRTGRRKYETTVPRVRPTSRPRPQPRRLATAPWLSLGLLIVVGAAGWYLLTSPDFRVQAADVEGHRLLQPEDIYRTAGVHGESVFYVNTHQVAERLRQMPLLRDARVAVLLPNRLEVQVTEREPVATWVSGGARVGVDEEGLILPAQAVNPDAITIEVLAGGPAQPGLQVDVQAIAVARELHELRSDWRQFVLSAERGIAIVTPEGWPVYFGWETTALARKVALLDRLTPILVSKGEAVEFIDLRFPTRPYYRKAQR